MSNWVRHNYVYGDNQYTQAIYTAGVLNSELINIFSWHLDTEDGGLSSLNRLPVPLVAPYGGYSWLATLRDLRSKGQTNAKALLCFMVDAPDPNAPGTYILSMLTNPTKRAAAIASIVRICWAHWDADQLLAGVSLDFEGQADQWASALPAFVTDLKAALVANGLPSYVNSYLSTRYANYPFWVSWAAAMEHVVLPIYSAQKANNATPTDSYDVFASKLPLIENQLLLNGLPLSKLLYIEGSWIYEWRTQANTFGATSIGASSFATLNYGSALDGPLKNQVGTYSDVLKCQWYAKVLTNPDADSVVKKFNWTGRPVYLEYYWNTPAQMKARFDEVRNRGYGGDGYFYLGREGTHTEYLTIL